MLVERGSRLEGKFTAARVVQYNASSVCWPVSFVGCFPESRNNFLLFLLLLLLLLLLCFFSFLSFFVFFSFLFCNYSLSLSLSLPPPLSLSPLSLCGGMFFSSSVFCFIHLCRLRIFVKDMAAHKMEETSGFVVVVFVVVAETNGRSCSFFPSAWK